MCALWWSGGGTVRGLGGILSSMGLGSSVSVGVIVSSIRVRWVIKIFL